LKNRPGRIDYLSWEALRKDFKELFPLILRSTKSLAHRNRLSILKKLLEGKQSFQSLKSAVDVKKTALANHLKQLLESDLIQKPKYGTYEITLSGKRIVESLVVSHRKFEEEQKLKVQESRGLSPEFVKSFFGK